METLIQKLVADVANLTKKYNDLTNPSTFPEEIVRTLVKKGFIRQYKTLIFTNSSGREFENLFVEYANSQSVISAENVGYYIEFTASTSDTCTSPAHGLSDGDEVYLFSTGTLPSPLSGVVPYYIRDATANTFKLSATAGGVAVNITDTGAGFHYMRVT